jgi:hypothetical protein
MVGTDVSSAPNKGTGAMRNIRVLAAAWLTALVLGATVASCGGSSAKSASSSPTEQVKRAWTTFFEGSTPPADRIALLQNGQRFAQVIRAESNSPLAKQTKVLVEKVTLLGSTQAKVAYTITLGGQPALPNQTGLAVVEGGRWKVSDKSFCALLRLQGTVPPACHGV